MHACTPRRGWRVTGTPQGSSPGINGDAAPFFDLDLVIAGYWWVVLELVWDPEPDFQFLLQGVVSGREDSERNGHCHAHADSCMGNPDSGAGAKRCSPVGGTVPVPHILMDAQASKA